MQILFYDDNEMHIFEVLDFRPDKPEHDLVDMTTLEDDFQKVVMVPHTQYTASIHIGDQLAELDPITMKRIARYNLDKENESLLNAIKRRKTDLDKLSEEYKNLSDRLERIKDIGADIWESGTEYCPENERDYEW